MTRLSGHVVGLDIVEGRLAAAVGHRLGVNRDVRDLIPGQHPIQVAPRSRTGLERVDTADQPVLDPPGHHDREQADVSPHVQDVGSDMQAIFDPAVIRSFDQGVWDFGVRSGHEAVIDEGQKIARDHDWVAVDQHAR